VKLLISLHPFAALGGGEVYTASVWKAMASSDTSWRLYVPVCLSAGELQAETPLLEYEVESDFSIRMSTTTFGALIMNVLPLASQVWIHQYAADPMVYQLLWAGPQARYWLTNLGCDPHLGEFGQLCSHWPDILALEISEYAAGRTAIYRLPAVTVTAGIWQHEVCEDPPAKLPDTLVSVGRILPHKGFEVTIQALPEDQSLSIIGNTAHDARYHSHLQRCALNRKVTLTGSLSHLEKNALVGSCQFLIASSTHRGYDGSQYPQVELLGLVLLEAVAVGTLPIASDIPPFLDIMRRLGLEDLTYPEGDAGALHQLLIRTREFTPQLYAERWLRARAALMEHYLWDNFASRVTAVTGGNPAPLP
jgi:glycosyltransferase involved in cell wall biosynthesis